MSRYCDITGAPVRTLQVFASNRVAYLYLLEGPSGVYVGLTVQPRAREVQHRCHGRAAAGGQPVHAAMRADGEQLWTFTVVGCSYDNNSSGRRFERALIAQLQDEGRNVLNADPLSRFCANRRRQTRTSMRRAAARAVGLLTRGWCSDVTLTP